jgi:hypothetical protein
MLVGVVERRRGEGDVLPQLLSFSPSEVLGAGRTGVSLDMTGEVVVDTEARTTAGGRRRA